MALPLKKKWIVQPPIPRNVSLELGDYSAILCQLLYNRGIQDGENALHFLRSSGALYNPFDLTGMQPAVDRLMRAINQDESIAVYGDYDVDGVTAAAILVHLLKRLGANVREYFPDRFEEGYGVNQAALENLRKSGIDLVITVDCGIRSPREVKLASSIGLDMIITDHHEPEHGIPEAVAVICPKQPGDEYPDKNLAGVGLAYKLAQGLLDHLPLTGIRSEEYLDLVAIGTVADVVPLKDENRTMVKQGLAVMRSNPRPGLQSLLNIARVIPARLSARDIGYGIGPRLNAAGRLETAREAFQVLMAEDIRVAGILAQKLDDRNRKRQKITQELLLLSEDMLQTEEEKFLLIQEFPEKVRFEPKDGGSLKNGEEEQNILGVVGLVAGRLAEAHYRPAIVCARGEDTTRASCRSIPEFHITQALDECSDLFIRHGGHAMAAGFTVENSKLSELKQRLGEIARSKLADCDLRPVIYVDMEIDLKSLKKADVQSIFRDIHQIDPTGEGNREPLFLSRNVRAEGRATRDGKHLQIFIKEGASTWDGIAFRQGQWAGNLPERVDLVYSLEANEFNGEERTQLNVRDLRPAGYTD